MESNLPDIKESEEGGKDAIDDEDGKSVHFGDLPDNQLQTNGVFQTEIYQDSISTSSRSKHSIDEDQTGRKSSASSDKSSHKRGHARVSNESRVAHADESESTRTLATSRTKSPSLPRHRSCTSSSKTSVASVKFDHKPANVDHDGTEEGEGGNVPTGDIKLSQMKCIHGNPLINGTDASEMMGKTVKWKSKNPCLLCDITDEAERMVQNESNKLLLEIVYPHEFYDRYSRARNSKKFSAPYGGPKEEITICKPAKVTRKVIQPERSWNRVPQTISKIPEEGGVLQYSGTVPEKRRKQEEEPEPDVGKKEIHVQCKPKVNALVILDNARGQKMVLKGLKGLIMRKHDDSKNKAHTETKHCK